MKNTIGVRVLVALSTLVCLAGLVGSSAATEPGGPEGESYIFRGTDGTPLPFQDSASIEEFLTTAKIVSRKKIPVGITNPVKITLSKDGVEAHAALKDVDRTLKNHRDRGPGGEIVYREWRDWYGYDIAAYRIDRLLGLDRVPPTVERQVGSRRAAVSIWLEGTITESDRKKKNHQPPDIARFNQQKQVLRIFDNLIANRDSNLGNTLIDGDWRIWFIDFTRSFGTSRELIYPEAVTHCERRVLEALRGLDRAAADEALGAYLSRHELDALFARRDRLLEHIDSLIAEQGETMVVFDERPPGEPAPWAAD